MKCNNAIVFEQAGSVLVCALQTTCQAFIVTDEATVRDVAALARLAISDQDIENATAEFNQTLALFDALSSADTTNAAPMINPLDSEQPLRVDRIETLVDRAALMQNAPASEDDYFLVPRVLD